MNPLEGRWNEVKGELKSWWGKLTDDDIEQIAGSKDRLIGIVQQKYGYLHDEAQREIERRLSAFAAESQGTSAALKQRVGSTACAAVDRLESLKQAGEDIANAILANETIRNLRTDLVQIIRRYPIQSLLIGFGLGYLLSRRWGR